MNSMIEAVGIDLVEIADIKKRRSDAFVARILSDEERHRYEAMTNEQRQLTFLAGRFAAKEAFAKVYHHFETPINFNDITVRNDSDGAPTILSDYQKDDSLHLSISHTPHYAVAIIIKEKAL